MGINNRTTTANTNGIKIGRILLVRMDNWLCGSFEKMCRFCRVLLVEKAKINGISNVANPTTKRHAQVKISKKRYIQKDHYNKTSSSNKNCTYNSTSSTLERTTTKNQIQMKVCRVAQDFSILICLIHFLWLFLTFNTSVWNPCSRDFKF